MIIFLQINVGMCRASQDLMIHTVRECGADVVLVSEQYRNVEEDTGWGTATNHEEWQFLYPVTNRWILLIRWTSVFGGFKWYKHLDPQYLMHVGML